MHSFSISLESSKTEEINQASEVKMFWLVTRNALDTAFPNMLITLHMRSTRSGWTTFYCLIQILWSSTV